MWTSAWNSHTNTQWTKRVHMTLTMSFGRLIIESTLTTHVTCAAHHNQYDKLHIYSTHMHTLTVVLITIMHPSSEWFKVCRVVTTCVNTPTIIHRYDQRSSIHINNTCHICIESHDANANKRVCDKTHWHRRYQHQHDQPHPSTHASQSSMPHKHFVNEVTHVFNHGISNTSTNNSDTDKGRRVEAYRTYIHIM